MTASLSATDAIEQGADQLSKGTASSPPLLQPSLTLGLSEVSCFLQGGGGENKQAKKTVILSTGTFGQEVSAVVS